MHGWQCSNTIACVFKNIIDSFKDIQNNYIPPLVEVKKFEENYR